MLRRTTTPALLAALGCALAAGCGSDSTSTPDGGSNPVFHGCATFDDRSGAMADRTIAFAGISYTPKCMRVRAGQSVTYRGSFSGHPLARGSDTNANLGSPNSPIPTELNTGMETTIAFPTAGRYPFYCTFHVSQGMAGVIDVVP